MRFDKDLWFDRVARCGISRRAVDAEGLRRVRAFYRLLALVRRNCFTRWRVSR